MTFHGRRWDPMQPCEVGCGTLTMPVWKDGKSKRVWRWICPPCLIAETACSTLHGVESQLRETLAQKDTLNSRLEAIRKAEDEFRHQPWKLVGGRWRRETELWEKRHGATIGELRKERQAIEGRIYELESRYGHWFQDPLGLERISDDRDFIERFLRGDE